MSHRNNTVVQAHKGIRAMLYYTAAIKQSNFRDANAATSLVKKADKDSLSFEEHVHTENCKKFPMLERYAPDVVADFKKQHGTNHGL